MANDPVNTKPVNQPAGVKRERESVLDALRKRREEAPVDREKIQKAVEAFDHDFTNLNKAIEDFSHVGSVVTTTDTMVLEVDGILVERITLRKIEQVMRFDAAEGYPREPRYEVVIEYKSHDGNMADKVIVTFEELFKRPTNEAVDVIRERIMEAKRVSGGDTTRVWAIHDEIHKKGGEIDNMVSSDGPEVTKKRDYDGRVRVEIEKVIDAIKSAIALNEAKKKIADVVGE